MFQRPRPVDGKDIRDYTQSSLRHALGVVQQEGALFNDTIMANIRYGDITASDAKVMQIAKAAKIHEKVLTWPKKYYTVVGERGIKLSGGEKQRGESKALFSTAYVEARLKQTFGHALQSVSHALCSKTPTFCSWTKPRPPWIPTRRRISKPSCARWCVVRTFSSHFARLTTCADPVHPPL